MALGLEFASVIVRKVEADRRLPGGLDEFAPAQPNYIEDEHLLRVGYMSTAEATGLMDYLLGLGLPDDAASVVQTKTMLPGWLRRGVIDGVPAVWLAAQDPGKVIPPLQGFLLQGPARLRDPVSWLHGLGGVSARCMSSTEYGGERLEITREEALIDLEVIPSHGADRVSFWGARRQDRNRRCRADIPLLEQVDAALRRAGAGT